MDEVLMLFGVTGFCPDCGDERLLLPADDGLDYCCTGCDGAVFLVHLDGRTALVERLAG
jgi:hypothetical protein